MFHFRYFKNMSVVIVIIIMFLTLIILSYRKISNIGDFNNFIIPRISHSESGKYKDNLIKEVLNDKEKEIQILQSRLSEMQKQVDMHKDLLSKKNERDKQVESQKYLQLIIDSMKNTKPNTGPIKLSEIQTTDIEDQVNLERKNKVKNMMKHSWSNYVKYAWGDNELRPNSRIGHSASVFGQNRLGITIIDSLDTLYIMGLHDEFKAASDWIKTNLSFKLTSEVSVFEVTIRVLGGLLTAYTFTNDKVFEQKAVELANNLLNAFDGSGLPNALINFNTRFSHNYQWAEGGCSILSEIGTLHMEFAYLSELTNNTVYVERVNRIREILYKANKPRGLYMNYIHPKSTSWCGTHASLAGLGDSFYEYLLKEYLRSNKKNKLSLKMYVKAMEAVKQAGMIVTSRKGHMYVADYRRGAILDKMDHLACFVGGMFALGSVYMKDPMEWLNISLNITSTCHDSYVNTNSKLGPESFHFDDNVEGIAIQPSEKVYLLRPETFESYFYLWRITKDQKYRDWAYDAVLALEKHARVTNGFSGVKDVYTVPVTHDDVQQSFLMAETLKYLYLIFSDDSLLPLDRWVFNSEGHPFPISDIVLLQYK